MRKTVVAVGEIGLDYYWDKEADSAAGISGIWFRRQLSAGKKRTSLPVIIHSRDAAAGYDGDHAAGSICAGHSEVSSIVFPILRNMAQEYVKMGYYIGVGGVVTFKNAKKLKEVVANDSD